MVNSIAALASNVKQQELGLAVGTNLMKTAMDSMEANAAGLDTFAGASGKEHGVEGTAASGIQPGLDGVERIGDGALFFFVTATVLG